MMARTFTLHNMDMQTATTATTCLSLCYLDHLSHVCLDPKRQHVHPFFTVNVFTVNVAALCTWMQRCHRNSLTAGGGW
jgi:hypothetical protein